MNVAAVDSQVEAPWFSGWGWGLMALGAVLRLVRYGYGASLWYDEALLALNIIHHSPAELLKPLAYNQGAPLGFLYLEKFATYAFGSGEYSLRLVPIIAGIGAILIFVRLLKHTSVGAIWPIALALFACNGSLVYFSSQAKQYSVDVLVGCLLLWVGFRLLGRPTGKVTWEAVVLPAIAIWFSYPAIFLLAGIALAVGLRAVRARSRGEVLYVTGMVAGWLLSFGLFYLVSLRGLTANRELTQFWRPYFFPGIAKPAELASWISETVFAVTRDLTGISPWVSLPLLAAGIGSQLEKNKAGAIMLLSPGVLAFFASAIHRYPFTGRFLIFLIPAALILLAQGAWWIANRFKLRNFCIAIAGCVLLAQPLYSVARQVFAPKFPDDIKPVIHYIAARQRPGAMVYVFHNAVPQFSYYAGMQGLAFDNVHLGRNCGMNPYCYEADLQSLGKPPQLWVLWSHVYSHPPTDERMVLLQQLDRMGLKRCEFTSTGAGAYLYELR